jgi:hypothetical protein
MLICCALNAQRISISVGNHGNKIATTISLERISVDIKSQGIGFFAVLSQEEMFRTWYGFGRRHQKCCAGELSE